MKIVDQSLGLFTLSDKISLFSGLELESGYLVDKANGARHFVRPVARPAICLLRKPERLEYWLQKTDWLNESQQLELLMFLESIGGIRVRRNTLGRTRITMKRISLMFYGLHPVTNARRFRPGVLGVLLGVASGMLPLVIMVAIVCIGAYGANIPIGAFVSSHLVFLASLYITTVSHELIHWGLAKGLSPDSQLLVRGLRVGLLHKPLTDRLEYRSALFGPLAGLASALSMTSILLSAGVSALWVVAVFVTGPMHLLSWLPSYGDGKVLWGRMEQKHA